MNILYLINHAGAGGSEKYVAVLHQAVVSRGDKAFLAYSEGGALSDLIPGARQLRMRHPFDLRAAKQLAGLCRELKIDIIHAQFPRENYIALLCKLLYLHSIEVVYTAHINLQIGRIHKLINWVLTSGNASIIAVCNSVKSLLITNKYPPERIRVIFNGVYPEPRATVAKEPRFTFVTLARLSSEKGMFFLLKAAKRLKDSGVDFQLNIAGEGPLRNQLQDEIILSGLSKHVFLLGYVTDIKSLLDASQVYINTSEHEALSFAILEGMAAGLPVIATRVGGNVDILGAADNGLLVDYQNVNQLAAAMATLMRDRTAYDRYSHNSREAIATTFNLANIIEQTYQVYLDAASQAKKRSKR